MVEAKTIDNLKADISQVKDDIKAIRNQITNTTRAYLDYLENQNAEKKMLRESLSAVEAKKDIEWEAQLNSNRDEHQKKMEDQNNHIDKLTAILKAAAIEKERLGRADLRREELEKLDEKQKELEIEAAEKSKGLKLELESRGKLLIMQRIKFYERKNEELKSGLRKLDREIKQANRVREYKEKIRKEKEIYKEAESQFYKYRKSK